MHQWHHFQTGTCTDCYAEISNEVLKALHLWGLPSFEIKDNLKDNVQVRCNVPIEIGQSRN